MICTITLSYFVISYFHIFLLWFIDFRLGHSDIHTAPRIWNTLSPSASQLAAWLIICSRWQLLPPASWRPSGRCSSILTKLTHSYKSWRNGGLALFFGEKGKSWSDAETEEMCNCYNRVSGQVPVRLYTSPLHTGGPLRTLTYCSLWRIHFYQLYRMRVISHRTAPRVLSKSQAAHRHRRSRRCRRRRRRMDVHIASSSSL